MLLLLSRPDRLLRLTLRLLRLRHQLLPMEIQLLVQVRHCFLVGDLQEVYFLIQDQEVSLF